MINDYLCDQCSRPKMEGGASLCSLCSFCNAYTGSIPVQSKHYGTQHYLEDDNITKLLDVGKELPMLDQLDQIMEALE